ncbi:DNA excision repair protein ERCC-6-like [Dendronephthya gigantea]|uniref:DNA excision repair protein ERCC-6-like n=1 Tax=Dendronephthya gigantea TaxID=151771 RepID=UPI00106C6D2A|nr:DNA excision repair protein ERCC-6-like [Dendronephthya gigantea]
MSEEDGPSSSGIGSEKTFYHRRNFVRSYGISIDSSKIHEVAFEEQPENLRALGVNIFDQSVFEEGVLQQVDEAIAVQEEIFEKEKLRKKLKSVEDELRNVKQKLQRPGIKQHTKESMLIDVQRLTQEENDILQSLQKFEKGKDSCLGDEGISIQNEQSGQISIDRVLHSEARKETEVERLVRLGVMTPFGSTVEKYDSDAETFNSSRSDGTKCGDNAGTSDDAGRMKLDGTKSNLKQIDTNEDEALLSSDPDIEINEPTVDSDEEYIPNEDDLKLSFQDDEHVLPEDDLEEPIGEASMATNKVQIPQNKAGKKSKRMTQSVKDDGDDRAYKIRIREFKFKKSLREKGIDYEGRDEEENSFWDEEGPDEEFDGGLKIPSVIWNKLFSYQKTGVKWLWELHTQQAGGIVGDEMGLGKTIQIIAFLAGLKYSNIGRRGSKQNGFGPVLIICPATILFQWVAELHKWWPEFRVAVLHDTGSYKGPKDTLITRIRNEPGILLTTYSGVRINQDHLLQSRWDYIILDEGHTIRNPDAEVTLTCKQFRTPHRLVLSGSPMQNNLRELWSLFDFVYPGKLGTLPVFMQEFSVPITMGGYSNATPVQVQTAFKCACVLRDTINPYLLRRLKKDVKKKLDLPNKNEQVLFCRLTEEQIELYKEYLASRDVGSILSGNMKVFPGLIMLRKICNHPDLTTPAGSLLKLRKDEAQQENTDKCREKNDSEYGHWKRAGKLIVVHSLLKLWKKQKHKVLLFTQTRQMLKILEIFVKSQGYNFCRMDGSTSISSRQPLIEKFNKDSSIFVFLLTTRVGGLGVNLIGANRVIIYDPDWNPGTDMQARERAWRVGQRKDVTIYRLLTTGTIEEKIYHRQIFKQFLTNRVLKDPKQRRFFKSNDLFELFTLDTSDNSKSGTETGAIFAGLGCEVAVPAKKKGTKRKHSVGDKNVLKAIQERTKEILLTQFASSKESCVQERNEMADTEKEGENVQRNLNEQSCDGVKFESKINNEKLIETSEERESFGDASECTRLPTTNNPSITGESSEKATGGKMSSSENAKVDDVEKTGSRESSLNDKMTKSSRKKSKKRKRNKVEGMHIGQLSHSEPYRPRQGPEDVPDKNADDDYILRKLFKKSGVHSALQHDTIVNSGNADHVLVENEAKRVAAQAAEAVKRSRDHCLQLRNTGLPTWTGQSGVVGSPYGMQERTLFGPKAKKVEKKENSTTLFTGKSLLQNEKESDLTKPGLGSPMSSTQLLARMRARNSIGGTNAGSDVQSSEQKLVAIEGGQQDRSSARLKIVRGRRSSPLTKRFI